MAPIRNLVHAACLAILCVTVASPAEPVNTSGDLAAVKAAFDSYVSAFSAGDARALADQWAEDAEYTAPNGVKYKGRANIRAAFDAFFKDNKGGKLAVTVSKTEFDAPDRAKSEGAAVFSLPGDSPSETHFVAVHVKRDGAWKLASVGEALGRAQGSARLKDLDWLIGDWLGGDGGSLAETSFEWAANKNFISASFRIFEKGELELEGMEIIGWDPVNKSIRSWFFDSSGRFGEGLWSKDGGRWTVKTTATLSRGQKGSAINVFEPMDKDSFKWSSNGREAAGTPLPSLPERIVSRKKPGK